jgi:hypothetical protein
LFRCLVRHLLQHRSRVNIVAVIVIVFLLQWFAVTFPCVSDDSWPTIQKRTPHQSMLVFFLKNPVELELHHQTYLPHPSGSGQLAPWVLPVAIIVPVALLGGALAATVVFVKKRQAKNLEESFKVSTGAGDGWNKPRGRGGA